MFLGEISGNNILARKATEVQLECSFRTLKPQDSQFLNEIQEEVTLNYSDHLIMNAFSWSQHSF